MANNIIISDLVRLSINGTAAAPSLAFGGGIGTNAESGCGLYGNELGFNAAVGGSSIMAVASTGVSVTGSLTASTSINGASLVLTGDVKLILNAGVPTDGTSGTGLGAAKGSLLIDTTNANLYINANTAASPTWKLVTRAA